MDFLADSGDMQRQQIFVGHATHFIGSRKPPLHRDERRVRRSWEIGVKSHGAFCSESYHSSSVKSCRRMRTRAGCASVSVPGTAILSSQIDVTDHEIDSLVYDLYGLTEEEIAIVEGRT